VAPWLAHLRSHLPAAREGTDPEGVHQVRVAIARVRVWLELGGWSVLHDDLRQVRTVAAAVRDLDVQLALELPPDYVAALTAERALAQRALVSVLDEHRVESVFAALGNLPPVSRRHARRGLRAFARRALRRGGALAWDDYAALHSLRRAVRRVRFALEWLGLPSAPFDKVQQDLGDTCDVWVALRGSPRVARLSAHPAHRRALTWQLAAATRRARRTWQDCRDALEGLA
jgi:CHAD domain-containing protein